MEDLKGKMEDGAEVKLVLRGARSLIIYHESYIGRKAVITLTVRRKINS